MNSKIHHLQIQGGEPLTHKEIAWIINACCDMPIEEISLASNGTILPSEDVVRVLSENSPRCSFRVSNYRCVAKEKRAVIVNTLREKGVNVSIYNFLHNNNTWDDFDNFNTVYREEARLSFACCSQKRCWTLADDFLTTCGRMASLRFLREHRFSESDDNVLNITSLREQNADFPEQLRLFRRNYHERCPASCGWCPKIKKCVPAAIQIEDSDIG